MKIRLIALSVYGLNEPLSLKELKYDEKPQVVDAIHFVDCMMIPK